MNEITYTVRIKSEPSSVYASLTQEQHIKRWWTDDCSVNPHEGAFGVFRWRPHGWTVEMRVSRLKVNELVQWHCDRSNMQNSDAWEGSDLEFSIERDGDGTVLRFRQEKYKSSPCYDVCNQGWKFVLGQSLKNYLEMGVGFPYESRDHKDQLI